MAPACAGNVESARPSAFFRHCLAWLLTFIAVVIGWVFFRAADVDAGAGDVDGYVWFNGVALPNAVAVRLGDFWACCLPGV